VITRLARAIPAEVRIGLAAVPLLLAVLAVTTRLTALGWVAGLVSGYAVTALLVAARVRRRQARLGPADWVTLIRAYLASGAAALVAQDWVGVRATVPLVILGAVALVLDGVDGRIARRTGTASSLGARFDGEVDAYLILVLSVRLSVDFGWWVVVAGVTRYAFLVAGWVLPMLARPLPFRYWRKIVTAATGVALVVAISGLLPRSVGVISTLIVLALLAESFGRDIAWLYRRGASAATRRTVAAVTTIAAWALIWFVLCLPARPELLGAAAWVAIPAEGIVIGLLAILLPARARRVVGVIAGALLAMLTLEKILSIGFLSEIGRPFNPLRDWDAIGSAVGVLRASLGATANTLLGFTILAAAALAYLIVAAVGRVLSVTARHRAAAVRAIGALAVVWTLVFVTGMRMVAAVPIAAGSTSAFAAQQSELVWDTARDRAQFAADLAARDPAAAAPPGDLVARLKGKDVLVIFVESYGQVALQDTSLAPSITQTLRRGTAELTAAGFSSRSALLDSPTFGGVSWLAHSTLQSGLWIDSTQRYAQLTAGSRTTLASAFGDAGWRTVSDIPSDDRPWAAGADFYHYDKLYDRTNVGYAGPAFSYAAMTDQFTLAAFQRLEMQPGHAPVMAEIDLASSHTPWTPLPRLVPWQQVGDGAVFDPMPAEGLSPDVAWRDADVVRRLYGESIEYSLGTVVSWIRQVHDENLVVLLLGDHQPAPIVSGYGATHLVPVSLIAADPSVTRDIGCWNWEPGLLPSPDAPTWRMDAFRDAFFGAFGRPGAAGVRGCVAP
jgi:phosphatidylglycerophosphate synthase